MVAYNLNMYAIDVHEIHSSPTWLPWIFQNDLYWSKKDIEQSCYTAHSCAYVNVCECLSSVRGYRFFSVLLWNVLRSLLKSTFMNLLLNSNDNNNNNLFEFSVEIKNILTTQFVIAENEKNKKKGGERGREKKQMKNETNKPDWLCFRYA